VTRSWDDWAPAERVRRFTEENKQLAAQLHEQMKALQGKTAATAKAAKTKGSRVTSESARGSEERTGMATQGGRGPRRNRDYELEQVCDDFSFLGGFMEWDGMGWESLSWCFAAPLDLGLDADSGDADSGNVHLLTACWTSKTLIERLWRFDDGLVDLEPQSLGLQT